MGKMRHMPGLRDIRSIRSVGARSIPKVQRSSYLELYTLRMEKDRLEKEIFALEKRKNSTQRQLDNLNKRIERSLKEVRQEQQIKTHRNVPTKPLKTMPISY